ncbi:MAG: hypothetical protein WCY05_08295 [Candidatus Omnitrophota bacterium]
MRKKGCSVILLFMFMFVFMFVAPVFAKNLTETEVVAVAKDALTGQAIAFEDAVVTYDKDNQKWQAWGEMVTKNPQDPNNGNLPQGVLKEKKYHTIYFDFEESVRDDIWVFVDGDTGKILMIYEEK